MGFVNVGGFGSCDIWFWMLGSTDDRHQGAVAMMKVVRGNQDSIGPLHKHWFAPLSAGAAWLVQMVKDTFMKNNANTDVARLLKHLPLSVGKIVI